MLKKFAGPVLCAILLVTPLAASAQTLAELQAQIQALLQQIAVLQGSAQTTYAGPMPYLDPAPTDDYPTRPQTTACPNLSVTMQRGSRDSMTGGQVTDLQVFLADRYGLSEEDVVTGYFGKTTHSYVVRFQQETGLPAFGIVGQLTRAKIAEVCGALPTQSASFSASPNTGPAPLRVTFSNIPITPANPSIDIDFGEGSRCTGISTLTDCFSSVTSPSHTYTQPGTYTVRILSSSSGNILASATITVTAGQANSGITVTAPNGGEQWEIGQLNTITWAPYGYNPDVNPARDVSVYLERSRGNGTYITLGKVMDTGKASLHTYFNIDSHDKWAEPDSAYVIRVVNNKTGATDRSDGTFRLLPRAADLKVDGSDGPITLTDKQKITVSWKTDWSSIGPIQCSISGVRSSLDTNAAGLTALPPSGTREVYYNGDPYYGTSVGLVCERVGTDLKRSDYVGVNLQTVIASAQVVSPNGGESIQLGTGTSLRFNVQGLTSLSVALYRNDQWLKWIHKDITAMEGAQSAPWIPQVSEVSPGDIGQKIFKIYITGQKADGTGYVDDKSDAPFSFVAPSPSGPVPTISAYASPAGTLPYGGSTTVYWSAQNATSCSFYKGDVFMSTLHAITASAFDTGALYADTTYSIKCSNSNGSAVHDMVIRVDAVPPASTVTLSPTDKGPGITLSNENYSFSQGTAHTMGRASFGAPFGKWYWEVEANSESLIGWATQSAGLGNFLGNDEYGWGYFSNGRVYHNVQALGYSAPAADWSPWASGDTLGFAYDGVADSMTVYKNNVLQGTITGLSDAIYPAYGRGAGSGTFYFGQASAGRTFYPSAGGYFKYAPPPGFQMLGGRLTTAESSRTAQLANALTALEEGLKALVKKLRN